MLCPFAREQVAESNRGKSDVPRGERDERRRQRCRRQADRLDRGRRHLASASLVRSFACCWWFSVCMCVFWSQLESWMFVDYYY
jgi:hypothetical protein